MTLSFDEEKLIYELKRRGKKTPQQVLTWMRIKLFNSVDSLVDAHLPAFDVGLPFLQNLQLLHLSLGFVDAGAHRLHHMQRLLHQAVVVVFLRSPLQQLLHM